MYIKLIVLFASIVSTFAQLNVDSFNLDQYYDRAVSSNNFTTLSDAIKDAEQFIESFNRNLSLPSLVGGLSIKGKTVWNRAWGFADLENQVKAKLDTKYRMCSISKSFTSALIGSMVDRGLIHYDDLVSKFVSALDFPAKSWDNQSVGITIGELLSHMGGVRPDELSDLLNLNAEIKNCTQALSKIRNSPLKFKPGTSHIYSNQGYVLLGAVIESIDKRPFPVVMSEFIHEKLRLNSSYVETVDLMIRDRASYYRAADEKHMEVNMPTALYDGLFVLQGYWPAGLVLSNVADMLAYGNLMLDSFKGKPNSVLSQKTMKNIWSAKTGDLKLPFHPEYDYAYGWAIRRINVTEHPTVRHRNIIWHNGGLLGASTMLYIYPEEEVVGVAMTNKGDMQFALEQMIIRMVENVYDLVVAK